MNGLDREHNRLGRIAVDAEVRGSPEAPAVSYSYGGVVIDVLSETGTGWSLPDDCRGYVDAPGAPSCARVCVSVTTDASLSTGERTIECEWTDNHAIVSTKGVVAHIQRLGPGNYVATARIPGDDRARASLTSALSSVLVSEERGLVLHASGIVIHEQAVLFIGPSGAGKTTASNNTRGARWLARDRATAFFTRGKWWCWGLPGGGADEVRLAPADRRAYPLAGILRVRREKSGAHVAALGLPEAVSVLRESVQSSGRAPEEEGRVLDACLELVQAVPVAELRSVREYDLTGVIEKWLGDRR